MVFLRGWFGAEFVDEGKLSEGRDALELEGVDRRDRSSIMAGVGHERVMDEDERGGRGERVEKRGDRRTEVVDD